MHLFIRFAYNPPVKTGGYQYFTPTEFSSFNLFMAHVINIFIQRAWMHLFILFAHQSPG
jgi:hypothetical protein